LLKFQQRRLLIWFSSWRRCCARRRLARRRRGAGPGSSGSDDGSSDDEGGDGFPDGGKRGGGPSWKHLPALLADGLLPPAQAQLLRALNACATEEDARDMALAVCCARGEERERLVAALARIR
jgi:hypothetical protein